MDPGSWNRYAYTRGDPVNRFDPGGTQDCDPESPTTCYCQIYGALDPRCDPNYCPPGICDGGSQGVPSAPSCDSFKKSMGLTDEQFIDASVIQTEALRLGLNLGGFSWNAGGMQVASGKPFSGSQTEWNLTGSASAMDWLFTSMCQGASASNCFVDDGYDALHPGTAGNQINLRQNVPTDSMQITGTFSTSDNQWHIQIDIDPNNPSFSFAEKLLHGLDVGRNFTSGRDTDYGSVAQRLGINPYKDNPWCGQ